MFAYELFRLRVEGKGRAHHILSRLRIDAVVDEMLAEAVERFVARLDLAEGVFDRSEALRRAKLVRDVAKVAEGF